MYHPDDIMDNQRNKRLQILNTIYSQLRMGTETETVIASISTRQKFLIPRTVTHRLYFTATPVFNFYFPATNAWL